MEDELIAVNENEDSNESNEAGILFKILFSLILHFWYFRLCYIVISLSQCLQRDVCSLKYNLALQKLKQRILSTQMKTQTRLKI